MRSKDNNLTEQQQGPEASGYDQQKPKVCVYADSAILWQSASTSYSRINGVPRSDVRPDYKVIKSRILNSTMKTLVEMGEYLTVKEAKDSVDIEFNLYVTTSRPIKSGSGRGFLQRMESLGWNTVVHHRPKEMPRYDWSPTITAHSLNELIKEGGTDPLLVCVASGSSAYLPLEEVLLRNGVAFLMMGYEDSLCRQYTRALSFNDTTLMKMGREGWGQ